MMNSKIDVASALTTLRIDLEQAVNMLEAMQIVGETEDAPETLQTMGALTRKVLDDAMNVQFEIAEWCRVTDMARIEREMVLAKAGDTDDGQAVRDLSRDLATKIEAICRPAMVAITRMQDQAGQIDAMVQRARDAAGCLRVMHHAGRDADKPEAGSLRWTVEDERALPAGGLAAVSARADRGIEDQPAQV